MHIVICLILNLLSRHALALPVRVTRELVVARLAEPDDVDLNQILLKTGGPGLLAARGSWGHDYEAAIKLGRALNERFGLTLLYLPVLQEVRVPGFSGLVLDRTGRTIANFVLRQTGSHGVGENVFANTFRTTHDFTRTEPWEALALKEARKLVNGQNTGSDAGFVLTTEEQLRHFERYVRAYRAQRAILAIGQRRPVWVLIHAVHWNPRWQDHFAGLTPAGSLISRVYLLGSRDFLDLTAMCAGELTEPFSPDHP